MKEFQLQIVTPDGLEFEGSALSVLVRAQTGDVEILSGHADLLLSLGTGRTRIITAEKTLRGSSSGGFVSVEKGNVRLVATTFEFKDDIDLERAKKAKSSAEEKLLAAKSANEITLAKAKLARAINRINVATFKV